MRNEKGQFIKGDKTLGGWNRGLKGYTNAGSFKKGVSVIPWNKGMKGYTNSGSYKKGQEPAYTPFAKGHIPWNDGLYREDAGYVARHEWVNKLFGKPNKCEDCGSIIEVAYHWHNLSKEYKRDRTDWIRLCVKCHFKAEKATGTKYGRKKIS